MLVNLFYVNVPNLMGPKCPQLATSGNPTGRQTKAPSFAPKLCRRELLWWSVAWDASSS